MLFCHSLSPALKGFTPFMLESVTVFFRCAFALALTVVTTLALTPNLDLPISLWDKANHALAYFVLTFLADHSFPSSSPGKPHLTIFLGLFAYGVLIEILQGQIPSREASLLDMVANGTGLVVYGVVRALTVKRHV